MSTFAFKQLYENSKQLLQSSSASLTGLPTIDRGLDQIDTESKLLENKSKSQTYDPYIKAHCFLAQGGVNHQEISEVLKKLDTSHTFERRDDLVGANVNKYLERSYETTMKEAFEAEDNLLKEFSGSFVKVDKDWTTMAQSCMDSWDQQTSINNTADTSKAKYHKEKTTTSDKVVLDLAKIIQKLNDHRLRGTKLDLISEMDSALLPPSRTSPSSSTTATSLPAAPSSDTEQAQQLLHRLTTQYDSRKGGPAWTLYDTPLDARLLESQTRLISIAKSSLEKEFIQYINVTLYKNAHKAKNGGNPSFLSRVKSFINYTFKKNDSWVDGRFEVLNDTPIWVCVYMLLRAGHISLAVDYINDNLAHFQSRSPGFIGYFTEYATSPTQTLQRTASISILAEYEEMKYGNEIVDPYKTLVYKILGRCQVNSNLPALIRSSEDYLWLQLSMIRLPADQEEYLNERYTLTDLQNTINDGGSARYDRNGTNPWVYFKVLLLTLQFEKAIGYLYKFEHCRVAAVHYAIVLAYNGLLRIPKDPIACDAEIVSQINDQPTFNFARLIHNYIKSAFADRHRTTGLDNKDFEQAALQYTYLLTLYPEEPMKRLSYLYIQNLILSFSHGDSVLGTPHQVRQVGSIDQYRRLLGIQDESAYSTHILHPIGERLVKKGRYAEAIHVYQLSNDDSKVIDVLIKELGDILTTTLKDIISAKKTQQQMGHRKQQASLIDMAQATLQHCNAHLTKCVSPVDDAKKHLIRAFILMFRGAWFYEENQYEEAIWAIQNTGVLPLEDNASLGHIRSLQDQMDNHGSDILYTLMPDLLLVTGDTLYHIWLSLTSIPAYRDTVKPHTDRVRQQIRNLVIFVGLMPTKIPVEITQQLNAIDIKVTGASDKRFV